MARKIILILLALFMLIPVGLSFPNAEKNALRELEGEIERTPFTTFKKRNEAVYASHKEKNSLDAKETLLTFFQNYRTGDVEGAVRCLKTVPSFLVLDHYSEEALLPYTGDERQKVEEIVRKNIFKNHAIYTMVRNLELLDVKEVRKDPKEAHYEVRLRSLSFVEEKDQVIDFLLKEQDTDKFLRFLETRAHQKEVTVPLYMAKDDTGWRIDLSKKENYPLVAALTGELSLLTLK